MILYQYLLVFVIAVVLDTFIYFFSSRKYTALKSGTDAMGIAPELMVFYRSLAKRGPFPYTQGSDTFYNSCNSWLLGALLLGFTCTIIVIIADLILQIIEWKNDT